MMLFIRVSDSLSYHHSIGRMKSRKRLKTFCILPDLERKLLCHQEEFSGSEPEYDSDYDDLDTAGQLSSFMNMFNKKGAGKKKSNSKIYSGLITGHLSDN